MSDRPVIMLPDEERVVVHLPDFPEETASRAVIRLPDLVSKDEQAVAEVVAEGQRLLFKHPVAAQRVYRALVAEGRRYAETEEGRAWRSRLQASPALRRLRPLWEAATFNVLEAEGDSILPTKLIELVAQALSHADIERTTAFLSEQTSTALEEPR